MRHHLFLVFLVLLLVVPRLSRADEDTEYRLGPDDLIEVKVWSRPDLSGDVTIDPSGYIRLPLVGEFKAEGLLPSQLGQELLKQFAIFDPSIPEVAVTVIEYNSRRITVVGEVRNPARYPYRTIPNLWEIILNAGGPTPDADLSKVQIVRKNREEGEPPSVTVDLSAGIDKTDPETLPVVRPRDTIIVPSLGGEIGSGSSTVQVLGAVRSPGVYRLGTAGTVTQALAVSGGALPEANLKKIRLNRRDASGSVVYKLDLQSYLYDGVPATDFELKAGDTVTIPSKSDLGSVLSSLLRLAPLILAASSVVIAFSR